MYKYNKNDNMTKELVWSSGQCFLLINGKKFACCLQYYCYSEVWLEVTYY